MYHSVTFIVGRRWRDNGAYTGAEVRRNTWDDWHLIPTSRPVVSAPEVKTISKDSPICDGVFDFSEAVSESVNYGLREGKMEFLIDNGHTPWADLYSEIMDTIHGLRGRMILEDDPTYYYEGRFFVEGYRSEKNWSYVEISYKLLPSGTELEPEPEPEPEPPAPSPTSGNASVVGLPEDADATPTVIEAYSPIIGEPIPQYTGVYASIAGTPQLI